MTYYIYNIYIHIYIYIKYMCIYIYTMARPGTCSTVPETTKTTKFEAFFGIAQPARMEWCGRWTSGGANLASQSSMRAMMEPRAASELSMVIFGRWLMMIVDFLSEHSKWWCIQNGDACWILLADWCWKKLVYTLINLVQNVVTACTKLAFLATLWFTNWSDTNILRVLPDMFVHKYPRIGEAANSNGWLY